MSMDKVLLKLTHRNLMDWLQKSREETVSLERKMNVLMLSVADLCIALADDETSVIQVQNREV
jgi:hypothetical protein